MDLETLGGLWVDWANGEQSMPDTMLKVAAGDVLGNLTGADPALLVPLMTRCRAIPELIAANRRSCDSDWKPAHLREVPMNARKAFNDLRLAAIERA